jgi:hypothetical protein
MIVAVCIPASKLRKGSFGGSAARSVEATIYFERQHEKDRLFDFYHAPFYNFKTTWR